jgi:hypothetical protein
MTIDFDVMWAMIEDMIGERGSPTLRRVMQHPQAGAKLRETFRSRLAGAGLLETAPSRPGPIGPTVAPESELGADELWTKRKREKANLEAMRLLAEHGLSRTYTGAERKILSAYSGWGGLSIAEYEGQFPPGWEPDPVGLIHEYYTPAAVTKEVARLLRPQIPRLPTYQGRLHALEPSAGIGRFVRAFAGPGFEDIAWHVVELSKISATVLQALRPDLTVYNGLFEEWLIREHDQWTGKLGLVLSNPPYGVRGSAFSIDPDERYAEKRAYLYSMRRSSDMLARDGVGVYLVPAGFMTGAQKLRAVRKRVMSRHHLIGAFRLPSALFPGAMLVVDLIFLRSRGGTLSRIPKSDMAVLDGLYYQENPSHILGKEIGKDGADDEEQGPTAKPRWGYQVEGSFNGLPSLDFDARPMVYADEGTTRVSQIGGSASRIGIREARGGVEGEGRVPDALRLDQRVEAFLAAVARQDRSTEVAAAGWPELADDLRGWVKTHGSPHGDQSLRSVAPSFVASFDAIGNLSGPMASPPVVEARFQGNADNLGHVLDYLYEPHQGGVLLADIAKTITKLGGVSATEARGILRDQLPQLLTSGRWCVDGARWNAILSAVDYYSGSLWEKYDRVKVAVDAPEAIPDVVNARVHGIVPLTQLGAQERKLLEEIAPLSVSDFARDESGAPVLTPNQSWIPVDIIGAWASHEEGTPVAFARDPKSGVMSLVGTASLRWTTFVAWANHIDSQFDPAKERAGRKGEKKTKAEADAEKKNKAEKQLERIAAESESFVGFLQSEDGSGWATMLERVYNRTFRGYVQPTYTAEPPNIARWTGDITLAPHQARGANRVVHMRRGMLAFDVGVGKTYTGIAILARARQEGWARRPIVLVPNTLLWKWKRDIERCCPDYRVGVIGADRVEREPTVRDGKLEWTMPRAQGIREFMAKYPKRTRALALLQALPQTPTAVSDLVDSGVSVDRKIVEQVVESGVVRSTRAQGKFYRTFMDTPATRGEKWRAFQAGMFDVMVVPYSMFNRTRIDRKSVEAYVDATPAILRHIQIAEEKKEAASKKKEASDKKKAKKAGKQPTEREAVVEKQIREQWITERLKLSTKKKKIMGPDGTMIEPDSFDEGVTWDTIGCDMLIVDEAQNFKNLYTPENRQGGIPEFMGAAKDGSNRAWQLDFRCNAIHRRTKGTGVVLLSATPAKNSPLEYYSLMQYIDHNIWLNVGITDPEQFTSRYLRIGMYNVVDSKMEVREKPAVLGFLNVPELRDVIFRYAEFRTAEEVGLKLPQVRANLLRIRMDERQEALYDAIVPQMEAVLSDPFGHPPGEALKLMSKLSLIAIHPDLPAVELEAAGLPPDTGPKVTHEVATQEGPRKVETLHRAGVYAVHDATVPATKKEPAIPAFNTTHIPVGLRVGSHEKLTTAVAFANHMAREANVGEYAKFAETSSIHRADIDAIQAAVGSFRIPNPDDGYGGDVSSVSDDIVEPYADDEADEPESESEGEAVEEEGSGKKKRKKRAPPRKFIENPNSAKFKELARRVAANPTCGHIVFLENVSGHYWIRQVLVEAGIGEGRIAIMNADEAPVAIRQQIADDFNGPLTDDLDAKGERIRGPARYDVIIANAVAYEGIDLQVRTCAIHHIDLPWEPATLQQRNGRGVRQGNTLGEIEINYYLCRRSMDGMRFSKIMGKRGWMIEFLTSQERSTNNPAASSAMGPEEIAVAIARKPSQARARFRESQRKADVAKRKKQAGRATAALITAEALVQRASWGAWAGASVDTRNLTAAENVVRQLQRFDPLVWAWGSYAEDIAHGRKPAYMDKFTGTVLVEGEFVQIGSATYEIGPVDYGRVHWRRVGEAVWTPANAAIIGAVQDMAVTEAVAAAQAADPPIDESEDIDTGPEVITDTQSDNSEGRAEDEPNEEEKKLASLPNFTWTPVPQPAVDFDPQSSGARLDSIGASDRWLEIEWRKNAMNVISARTDGRMVKAVVQADGTLRLESARTDVAGAIPPTRAGLETFAAAYKRTPPPTLSSEAANKYATMYWRPRIVRLPSRGSMFDFTDESVWTSSEVPQDIELRGATMNRVVMTTSAAGWTDHKPSTFRAAYFGRTKGYDAVSIVVFGEGRNQDAKFNVYDTSSGGPSRIATEQDAVAAGVPLIDSFGASKAGGLSRRLAGLDRRLSVAEPDEDE